MSIIYDALKKVETSKNLNPEGEGIQSPPKPKPKRMLKIYLLYVFVVCFGFLMANLFFNCITKQSQQGQGNNAKIIRKEPTANTPIATATEETRISTPTSAPMQKSAEINPPASALTTTQPEPFQGRPIALNGIFFSEDKGYALINNRIVNEGDNINGAQVMRITADEVELKTQEGSTIRLSTSR